MKNALLFTLLFFCACETSNETKVELVARVGKEKLTRENLLLLAGNQAGDMSFYSRAINKWVENKLLYNAAVSIGLDRDLVLSKKRDLFYESLLISSFIEIQKRKKTKTTKKEVSDYYLKNKKSFKRTDDEVVVKHFVFTSKKEAKKTVKELKKKKPKRDIEKILKEQRVETKTVRKKDAGSNLVAFVFAGAVGDFLGPKKHKDEFHVFQILQKHKEGSYLGLEKVYDEVYQRIYKEKEAMILSAVLDSLYLNSDVFVSQKISNK
tara:strand:- start:1474 stop:2268 length:795 start_codon:yes stop_codon:yes gene_type:complete